MKHLSAVLALLCFGTTVAVACPGAGSMKDVKADQPVPQQSKPAQPA